jgi:hypothetical protein
MAVVLRSDGSRVSKKCTDDEAVRSALEELSNLGIAVIATAAICHPDRIGILAASTARWVLDRFKRDRVSAFCVPGEVPESEEEEARLTEITVFEARKIPTSLLARRKVTGERNRKCELTPLGWAVASQAEEELLRRIAVDSDGETSDAHRYGRGTVKEVHIVPVSGRGRLRGGYWHEVYTLDGESLRLLPDQTGIVRSWRDTPPSRSSTWGPTVSRFDQAMGVCLVEFPEGVRTASGNGREEEHLDFPMFLWVAGADMVCEGRETESLRFTRVMETWTGDSRITKEGQEGERIIVWDSLQARAW